MLHKGWLYDSRGFGCTNAEEEKNFYKDEKYFQQERLGMIGAAFVRAPHTIFWLASAYGAAEGLAFGVKKVLDAKKAAEANPHARTFGKG